MKANFQEVSEFHLNKRKLFHQFFTLPLNLNSYDVLIEHYKSVFNSKYLFGLNNLVLINLVLLCGDVNEN